MFNRREHFAVGLHPLYLPLYQKLGEALGDEWQPISGLRSFEDQAKLYACGRTHPGSIVTQAGPGLSFHNYGLASDWDYFPEGRYTPLEFNDQRWQLYTRTCLSLSLRCIAWEKPHNELDVMIPIREILAAYNSGGPLSVTALLTKGI